MQWFLEIPLAARYVLLGIVGLVGGGQVNRGIYSLAWFARPISPWSKPPPEAPPRRWYDRIPVLGWLTLRRETEQHGRGFWIRPLLIEISLAFTLVALYAWEVAGGGLAPPPVREAWPPEARHAVYLSHVILISLMAVASFIDIDEKTIPDAITLPGALIAFTLAAVLPTVLLPAAVFESRQFQISPTWLTTPIPWPEWLNDAAGLAAGLACFLAWWVAMGAPRLITRRGPRRALRYFVTQLVRGSRDLRRGHRRRPVRWLFLIVAPVGGAGVALAWSHGGDCWRGLLTSLVGATFGGGLVLAVRTIGGAVLGREAMGYGDVTLMAMIGAFLGWQAALIVFFLAPFAGMVIAVGQWIATGRNEIYFGPFLCAAAVALIVAWPQIWMRWGLPIFGMGWLVPAMTAGCLVMLAVLLFAWQAIKMRVLPPDDE